MSKLKIFVILFIAVTMCLLFAIQKKEDTNRIFEDFHRINGKYSMFFINVGIKDSLPNYFCEKQKVNEIISNWSLKEKLTITRCSDDYVVYIVNEDTILEKSSFNFNCNEFSYRGKKYFFEKEKHFDVAKDKLSILNLYNVDFSDYDSAKAFYQETVVDNYILPQLYDYSWLGFEQVYQIKTFVKFRFNVDSIKQSIKNQIIEALPKEMIMVEDLGVFYQTKEKEGYLIFNIFSNSPKVKSLIFLEKNDIETLPFSIKFYSKNKLDI